MGLSLAFTGKALSICVPFAAIVFALIGWSPVRGRGTLVRLHANGISVVRRGAVDAMSFDDVDELWYELDVTSAQVARLARIHAFRLIDHHGRELRVRVSIDRDSVTIRGKTLPWSALRLVLLQSGRIAFLRRQTLVPWKTVSLDRVPHPSVFVKLVAETAKKVDRDFPFWAR